jgi:hypothetical protein
MRRFSSGFAQLDPDLDPEPTFRCWGCGEACELHPDQVVEIPLDAAARRELGPAGGSSAAGLVIFLCADCRETIGLPVDAPISDFNPF